MTAQTELLLINASRAQLVREVIRPALDAGEIVLCDRFYDSTTAYQGHGRQLDLKMVRAVIDIAVGGTRPNLTLLLAVSPRNQRTAPPPCARPRCPSCVTGWRRATGNFSRAWRRDSRPSPPRIRTGCAWWTVPAPVEVVCEKIWEIARPVLPKDRTVVNSPAGFATADTLIYD